MSVWFNLFYRYSTGIVNAILTTQSLRKSYSQNKDNLAVNFICFEMLRNNSIGTIMKGILVIKWNAQHTNQYCVPDRNE